MHCIRSMLLSVCLSASLLSQAAGMGGAQADKALFSASLPSAADGSEAAQADKSLFSASLPSTADRSEAAQAEESLFSASLPSTADGSEAAQAEVVPISAPSAVLMEASTGQVIYEKNAHAVLRPASITKIMTLILIFDALSAGKLSLDDVVTVSEHAASMGGSQVFLEPGETQTADTMIKCISVASANDACVAYQKRNGQKSHRCEKDLPAKGRAYAPSRNL